MTMIYSKTAIINRIFCFTLARISRTAIIRTKKRAEKCGHHLHSENGRIDIERPVIKNQKSR